MRMSAQSKLGLSGSGLFATFILLALALSSCAGFGKSSNAGMATTSQTSNATTYASGLAAFQGTVYPLVTQNCVQCHGSVQSPMFASSSVSSAYSNAKTVVSFSSPLTSQLAIYAGNAHCGASACSSSSLSASMVAAITTWAAVENSPTSTTSSPAPGGNSSLQAPSSAINYFTAALSIPTNLPGPGNTLTTVQWNLNQLAPANSYAAGATFQMGIQQLSSTLYRIANPQIVLQSGGFRALGVHVMIKPASQSGNGQESPEAMAWTAVDRNISTSYPFYATSPMYGNALTGTGMELPVLSNQDALVIGFEKIGALVANCQNMNGTNGFEANVKPIFENTCLTCHNASSTVSNNYFGNLTGEQTLPMDNVTDAQLCAQTLQYVNFGAPSESNLLVCPQGFNDSHPITTFDATPIIEWIQSEAAIGP